MSGESGQQPSGSHGLAYEQARLAYNIIQALLEHTRVTQDLVALMASVLGDDTQEALVKYDFLAPGTELKVFDGDTEVCAARVAELPLVRGSWYEQPSDEQAGAGEPG